MIAVRLLQFILYINLFISNGRLICLKTTKRWDYWKMSRRLDSATDPSLCLRRSTFERQMVLRAEPLNIERFLCVFVCEMCRRPKSTIVSKYYKYGDWESPNGILGEKKISDEYRRRAYVKCDAVELSWHDTIVLHARAHKRRANGCGDEPASFSLMCGRCMRVPNQPNYSWRPKWSSPHTNMNMHRGPCHMHRNQFQRH